jgi:hypothetical protein
MSAPKIEARTDTGDDAAPTVDSPAAQAPTTSGSYSNAVEWTQDPVVARFRDWLGAPALVSHWIVKAAPNTVTVLNFQLAADAALQIDIIVTADGRLDNLSAFSVVSASGTVVPSTPLSGHHRLTGLKVGGGVHTFVFDNSRDGGSKTIHLLVVHHAIAPDA